MYTGSVLALMTVAWKFFVGFGVGVSLLKAWNRFHAKENGYALSKLKGDTLRSIYLCVDHFVDAAVKKAISSAGEDVQTQAGRRLLVDAAVARVCDSLNAHGLGDWCELVKMSEGALLKFIEDKVEAKLHDVQRAKLGASEPPTATDTSIRLPVPTLR